MKALAKAPAPEASAEEGLWWIQDIPEPCAKHVLTGVLGSGLSGTDVHIFVWDTRASFTVHVLAFCHEFVTPRLRNRSRESRFQRSKIRRAETHLR
jgi:hypothetical protein